MNELYLILHKVRGEPAFDIAIKEWYGDEEGWMLKTTEQRCYPAKAYQLDGLKYNDLDVETDAQQSNLDDLPDFHFQRPPGQPAVIKTTARELLAKLGLGAPSSPPIKRRKMG